MRRWIAGLLLVVVLGAGAYYALRRPGGGFGFRQVAQLPDANLVLVTIDTLRADRIGKGFTPRLDVLGSRGVVFTNVRAVAPLTLPSHVSIMTGTLPPAHGVHENGTQRFDGSIPTLARLLKTAGYSTAAFVGAYVLDRRFGLIDGFDVYEDRIPRDPDALLRLEAERPGAEVVDAALRWLTRRAADDSPYFIWVHLFDPHAPYEPPEAHLARGRGNPYDGEVAYADEQVGRLLDSLENDDSERVTVTAVMGDHGESLGEHGERTHGMLLYESALRVPLILASPRALPAAIRMTPASLADVAPTLLSLLGVEVPASMSGRDLLGMQDDPARDIYSETEYPRAAGWSPLYGLTSDRWKLVVSAETELYDLSADPRETSNQAANNPSVVRTLKSRVDRIRSTARRTTSSTTSPETEAQLRSLGYVASPAPTSVDTRAPNPARHIAEWVAFEPALSALAAGDHAKAVALLRPLAAKHENAPAFQLAYATALHESGDLPGALNVYRRAVQRWPRDATLYHQLAAAARDAGIPEEAVRAEQAALALNPDDAAAQNGMGLLFIDAGRADEAAHAFNRATQLDPNNASYWTNLGNALRETKDEAGAEAAYRRAAAVDPQYPDAVNGLGVLLVQAKRPAEAIPWFEKALAGTPHFYEARLNLGIAYQETGDRARAAEQYRQVLAAPAEFTRERDAAANLLKMVEAPPAPPAKTGRPSTKGRGR